jgi:hypothetical protein
MSLPLCFAVLTSFQATEPPQLAYDLNIRVEPGARRMDVEGTMVVPPVGREYDRIHWIFAKTMTIDQVEIISPASVAGLITPEGAEVALKGKVGPKEELRIRFRYHGGDKPDFVFYVGPEAAFGCGTNAKWYPMAGPKIESMPFTAYPQATGRMTFDLPADWTVAGTGRKMTEAAAAGRSGWRLDAKAPCDFGFAAGPFKVYNSPGKLPVTVYRLKDDPTSGDFAKRLRAVVEHLETIYGKLPYPEFSVVEVPNEAARAANFGGVAMAGAMVGGDVFFAGGFNTAFFGHEVGHQWWGNGVRSKGTEGNYLLTEAMAQYGSLRCVEALDEPALAVQYRRGGYPGYINDQCGEGYLLNAAAGLDHALINLPDSGLSHTLADQKGFLMYHMLEQKIGRKAMDAALRATVRKHLFSRVSLAEFIVHVQEQTPTALKSFWDQWLRRTGAPVVDLAWTGVKGGVTVTLVQGTPAYELQIPVRIHIRDGRAWIKWLDMSLREQTFQIDSPDQVARVELDPDFEVLMMTTAKKEEVDAMAPVTRARRKLNDGDNEGARAALVQALESATGSDAYGVEFTARYLLSYIQLNVDKDPAAAIKTLEPSLVAASRPARLLAATYLRLAEAHDQLGHRAEAKRYALSAMTLEALKDPRSSLMVDAKAIFDKP